MKKKLSLKSFLKISKKLYLKTSNKFYLNPIKTPRFKPSKKSYQKNSLIHFHFLFVFLMIFFIFSCSKNRKPYSITFQAMDTVMNVRFYEKGKIKAEIIANQVISSVNELEETLSVTKKSSELYKINNAKTFPLEISDITYDLLIKSIKMSEKTDGNFNFCLYPLSFLWGFTTDSFNVPKGSDILELLPLCDWKNVIFYTDNGKTAPSKNELFFDAKDSKNKTFLEMEKGMMMDFGGIAKGYAGDEIIKILKDNGISSAILDLGGNIQLLGMKNEKNLWKVGIKDPFYTDNILGLLQVSDKAVITSAIYERYFTDGEGNIYGHILDGNTGKPAQSDIISATAIAKEGWYADALSTAMFVMGSEKAYDLWKKSQDFDYILITKNHEVLITKDIEKSFTMLSKDYFLTFP